MWLLQRLRNNIRGRDLEKTTLILIRVGSPHFGDHLDRFPPLRVKRLFVDLKRFLLYARTGLRSTPIDPPSRKNIQGRHPFGNPNGVVIAIRKQSATVPDPYSLCLCRNERQKD